MQHVSNELMDNTIHGYISAIYLLYTCQQHTTLRRPETLVTAIDQIHRILSLSGEWVVLHYQR